MKKWIDTRTRTRNRETCDFPNSGEQGIWSVVLVEDEETSELGSLGWPSVSSGLWPFRIDGEESCIQRTWKKAKLVSSPHQVMTVMKQAHWGYVWKLLIQETLGRMVWQPENRGNALGLYLPLSYIRSHDPDGIVILWSVGQTGEVHDPVLERVRSAIERVTPIPDMLVGLECSSASDGGQAGMYETRRLEYWCHGSKHFGRQGKDCCRTFSVGWRRLVLCWVPPGNNRF